MGHLPSVKAAVEVDWPRAGGYNIYAIALMSQPDIDGALVGGASLDPHSFAQIVKAPREE